LVQKRWIVILIALGTVAISLPLSVPVLGFQYTFWKMHQVLDAVPESELIDRTRDLPEVRAFLSTYQNSTILLNTDFHIGADYFITECEYSGKHCNEPYPSRAELEIIISLDTGYPDHSRFWCQGNGYGKYPLGSDAVVQAIKECA
jgi:hypothetical protein